MVIEWPGGSWRAQRQEVVRERVSARGRGRCAAALVCVCVCEAGTGRWMGGWINGGQEQHNRSRGRVQSSRQDRQCSSSNSRREQRNGSLSGGGRQPGRCRRPPFFTSLTASKRTPRRKAPGR